MHANVLCRGSEAAAARSKPMVRLDVMQKELSALKNTTNSLAINMGLGMHANDSEGRRMERAARAQRVKISRSPVTLSQSPSPTSKRQFAESADSPSPNSRHPPARVPIHLAGAAGAMRPEEWA